MGNEGKMNVCNFLWKFCGLFVALSPLGLCLGILFKHMDKFVKWYFRGIALAIVVMIVCFLLDDDA